MDTIGWLDVRVYTSQAQLPVPGATVAVTQKGRSGRYRLLSLQVTNSSGNIKTVAVETPASIESTEPEDNDAIPAFATCEVWAEYPGFVRLMVEGVQIFPGVTTFQGMELSPAPAGESGLDETEIQNTPDQNL